VLNVNNRFAISLVLERLGHLVDSNSGTAIRRLRSDPRLHQLPPYLSLLCVLGGIFWLLLLPLNQYSRNTYISENALLPGQVHTYFAGSEQNVFRGYREELRAIANQSAEGSDGGTASMTLNQALIEKIETIFRSAGLPTATQYFEYHSAGSILNGTNVYSVLQAPRGDGTEAIVLLAPQYNAAGKDNTHGIALLLTLARYFKSTIKSKVQCLNADFPRMVPLVQGHHLSYYPQCR
jgi:GPI-anchor transamidase subunit GAA1